MGDVELKKLADAMQGLTAGLNACQTVLERSFGASQINSFEEPSPDPEGNNASVTTCLPNNKSAPFLVASSDNARNRYMMQCGEPRVPSRKTLSPRSSPDIRRHISRTLLRGASRTHTPPPSTVVVTEINKSMGQSMSNPSLRTASPVRSMDEQGSSQCKARQIDWMIAESVATLRKIEDTIPKPCGPPANSHDNTPHCSGGILQARPLTQNRLTHEIDYMQNGAKTSHNIGSQGLVPSTQELGHGQPRRVFASVSAPVTRM